MGPGGGAQEIGSLAGARRRSLLRLAGAIGKSKKKVLRKCVASILTQRNQAFTKISRGCRGDGCGRIVVGAPLFPSNAAAGSARIPQDAQRCISEIAARVVVNVQVGGKSEMVTT